MGQEISFFLSFFLSFLLNIFQLFLMSGTGWTKNRILQGSCPRSMGGSNLSPPGELIANVSLCYLKSFINQMYLFIDISLGHLVTDFKQRILIQ